MKISDADELSQPRTVVWQHGAITAEPAPERWQEVLADPHALLWLDIVGESRSEEALLRNVFHLAPITLETMGEERERAKFTEQEHYFYLVVHGLAFDTPTGEASTPQARHRLRAEFSDYRAPRVTALA